ncbi:BrnT family toxin [bacterium]|nr:BrnT family toxin [bacterium]
MKYFSWNTEKNEKLRRERNVSFEGVVFHIQQGNLLDIVEHPNQEKYKEQHIFVVNIENYVYLVPFVETEDEIFLKTIIPNRKATKKYLRGGEEEDE